MIRLFIIGMGLILVSAACSSNQKNSIVNNETQIEEITTKVSADTIKVNIQKLASFHTRHTTSDTSSDSVGIGAARRWIYKKFKRYQTASGNRLKVKYNSYVEDNHPRIDEPTEIVNVVAVLPGTQLESKDRRYIVSGHYDSRVSDVKNDTSYAPGANDNASGTAAVMELARVLSQYEFDATIIFMAVAGEEQGLLGAKHYAQKANKLNRNIAAMITNDLIGNTTKSTGNSIHDNEVRVFTQGIPAGKELSKYHRTLLRTGGENDTPSRQLGRFIYEIADQLFKDLNVNLIYRKDRYLRAGDHSAFLEQGYPAVRFSEPHEIYERQHEDVRTSAEKQYGDLPRFVDYSYVAKITELNAAVLTSIANAPARPRKPRMEVEELENNTTLLWKPNKEPDLRGYEIVWRQTHSPYWQNSVSVGDTTRYTLKSVSKDNYLFGVRAVDKFDNKSPAVYPLPER